MTEKERKLKRVEFFLDGKIDDSYWPLVAAGVITLNEARMKLGLRKSHRIENDRLRVWDVTSQVWKEV
jgi:hypothetical protein